MITYIAQCYNKDGLEVKSESFTCKKRLERYIDDNLGTNTIASIDTTTIDTARKIARIERDVETVSKQLKYWESRLTDLYNDLEAAKNEN